ncbi:MAG: glycosyltransferase family 2 protein [Nitrososphaerota archaeon]|nr:glycosyltransferase family 2 protein [Nitrososphaerota archaeon]
MSEAPFTIGVVVPTFNAGEGFRHCMASIAIEQVRPPDRIVVVDGGSSDSTVEIAREFDVDVVEMAPNRCLQRNAGAGFLKTDVVVFIDQDMRLGSDVIEECSMMWSEHGLDTAIVISERMFGSNFWAAVRGFQREFFDTWWMEAARGYSTVVFNLSGGFDPSMVGFEDWDLDQRVRGMAVPVIRTHATIRHDEGSPSLRQLLSKKAYAFEVKEAFIRRHPLRASLCFSVSHRLKLFLRSPIRIVKRPLLAFGCLVLGIGEVGVAKCGWGKGTYRVPERRE